MGKLIFDEKVWIIIWETQIKAAIYCLIFLLILLLTTLFFCSYQQQVSFEKGYNKKQKLEMSNMKYDNKCFCQLYKE